MFYVLSLIIVFTLVIEKCSGSIYPVEIYLPEDSTDAVMRDTPMFALKDSPSWFGLSEPYIKIKGRCDLEDALTGDEDKPVIQFFHGWSKVPVLFEESILDNEPFIPCSDETSLLEKNFIGIELVPIYSDGVEGKVLEFEVNLNVTDTAWHKIVMSNCGASPMNVTAVFEFKNPYGYLNGWAFGSLPMNGLLCLGYGILAITYVVNCFRNREHILRLQYAIIAVIIMGLIERIIWFFTYVEMNSSGGKTCCPVRTDLKFSIALAVFKRTSSAVLLLAVCLGFGVVKPKLDKQTNVAVVTLGVLYTFASLNLDMNRVADISTNGKQTDPLYLATLMVSICDVIIVFWIYFAMSELQQELRDGHQIVKLGMYQSLARSLTIWAFIWFLFTVLEVLVSENKLDIDWRYRYVLVSFWDFFYLGILIQIAYLWSPSPLTAQYAYSQQLPTSEDLDEFDAIGLEMQHPETAAEFVIGDDDDDDKHHLDDDDFGLDDDDFDMNGKTNGKVAIS